MKGTIFYNRFRKQINAADVLCMVFTKIKYTGKSTERIGLVSVRSGEALQNIKSLPGTEIKFIRPDAVFHIQNKTGRAKRSAGFIFP